MWFLDRPVSPVSLATRCEAGRWSVQLPDGKWLGCDSANDAETLASAPLLESRAARGELDSVLGIAELCCLSALFRGYAEDAYADSFERLANCAGERLTDRRPVLRVSA